MISLLALKVLEMLTVLVIPAGGALASKSVAILKPTFQQLRVSGPLVQTESRSSIEVASRSTWVGITEADASNPKLSNVKPGKSILKWII